MSRCGECRLGSNETGCLYCEENLGYEQCIDRLQNALFDFSAGDLTSKNYILLELSDLLDEYSEVDENGLHDPKWCGIKEAYGVVKNAPAADRPQMEWIAIEGMQPPELHGKHYCSNCGSNNLDLITALRELESSLKAHSSVKTIFRDATEREIREFLSTASDETYADAWNSLVSNISTLSSVNYEEDENGPTEKVASCVAALTDAIKKDSSFPKEVFQNDENKVLLISVASMVNLFGVNCVIYHDISQFVDDNLDMYCCSDGEKDEP